MLEVGLAHHTREDPCEVVLRENKSKAFLDRCEWANGVATVSGRNILCVKRDVKVLNEGQQGKSLLQGNAATTPRM